MSEKRVVVAGAGPAGSAAAMGLLEKGIHPILLDRRTFPRTKVCGSGLSPWTLRFLDQLGVGNRVRKKAFRVHGAIIAGSNGEGVELRGDRETAILLREELDELLAYEAKTRGADFRDGVRIKEILRHGNRVLGVDTDDGFIQADAVIDCTGATGSLTEQGRKGRTLHTILGWYKGVAGTQDVVELFFDETLKPHYGWIFPETHERVNIGLVYEPTAEGPNARSRFEAFVDRRLGRRLQGAEQLGKLVGHPVHVSSFPRDTVADGVLIAGEAARLVDAATAEGIFHALLSGHTAGTFLGERIQMGGSLLKSSLYGYQRLLQVRLGARLLLGRSLMTALRSPILDFALQLKDSRTVQQAIRKAFVGLYHG